LEGSLCWALEVVVLGALVGEIICFLMWPLKNILGIKIKVQGEENLNTKGPYIVVANHQANMDIIGMFEILPDQCTFIVKREILYMGPAGLASWLCGFIFINRRKKGDAIHVMSQVAQNMLWENFRVWVFPEGTRNFYNKASMLSFKRGAFHMAVQAQVPIIPVVMSSFSPFFSKSEKRFTPGECSKVRWSTQGLGPDDVPELTERVRDVMISTYHNISEDAVGYQGTKVGAGWRKNSCLEIKTSWFLEKWLSC
uniref:1-acyl-sn-glycerol-3-phosphate acyltransferase n=1 Tax=Sphenodon punctatus TaxID=8508 RepID=A0A8D0HDV0_SPHPU